MFSTRYNFVSYTQVLVSLGENQSETGSFATVNHTTENVARLVRAGFLGLAVDVRPRRNVTNAALPKPKVTFSNQMSLCRGGGGFGSVQTRKIQFLGPGRNMGGKLDQASITKFIACNLVAL